MLIGRIERLCGSGCIVGWALDKHRPLQPMPVQVRDARHLLIASGLAHHYRDAPDPGAGWHEFRLLSCIEVTKLKRRKLSLWHADSGERIARSRCIPMAPVPPVDGPVDGPADRKDAEHFIDDPTTLDAPEQLTSLTDLFRRYQQQRGVETFVRCCYAYVLGRPADPAGLCDYALQLRTRALEPHEVLLSLLSSVEFRERRTRLPAPWCAAFPFK